MEQNKLLINKTLQTNIAYNRYKTQNSRNSLYHKIILIINFLNSYLQLKTNEQEEINKFKHFSKDLIENPRFYIILPSKKVSNKNL